METTTEEPKKLFPKTLFNFEERPLSYSSMKHMLQSPIHFADNWVNGKLRPKKKVFEFGSMVDELLFFPDTFKDKYVVQPIFKGKGSVKAREDWKAQHKGVKYATEGSILIAKKMAENVKTNPNTRWLYESTVEVQKTIKWQDKKTGLWFIIKIDAKSEIDDRVIVWDLKSAKSAAIEKYQRDAVDFCYPLQGQTYCNGFIRTSGIFPEFYNVVMEKAEPFAVNSFRADADFMSVGKKMFQTAVDRILYCMEHDCFDAGYDFMNEQGYDVLSVPAYMKTKWLD